MRSNIICAALMGGVLTGCASPRPIVLHPVQPAPLSTAHAAHPRPHPHPTKTAACGPGDTDGGNQSATADPSDKEALFRAFTAEENAAAQRPTASALAAGPTCHPRRS